MVALEFATLLESTIDSFELQALVLVRRMNAQNRASHSSTARPISKRALSPPMKSPQRLPPLAQQSEHRGDSMTLRSLRPFDCPVHILQMNGDSYRLNQSKHRSPRPSPDPPASRCIFTPALTTLAARRQKGSINKPVECRSAVDMPPSFDHCSRVALIAGADPPSTGLRQNCR